MESLVFEELGIKDSDIEVHGYRILVKEPKIPEKTRGGIWRPDQSLRAEERESYVGLVIKMGKGCYLPEEKYGYSWCKVGDWILYSNMERRSLKLNGHQCYIIVDEKVDGSISSPGVVIESLRSENESI